MCPHRQGMLQGHGMEPTIPCIQHELRFLGFFKWSVYTLATTFLGSLNGVSTPWLQLLCLISLSRVCALLLWAPPTLVSTSISPLTRHEVFAVCQSLMCIVQYCSFHLCLLFTLRWTNHTVTLRCTNHTGYCLLPCIPGCAGLSTWISKAHSKQT